eukprot:2177004-Prorocentrum_lima.AAC.1
MTSSLVGSEMCIRDSPISPGRSGSESTTRRHRLSSEQQTLHEDEAPVSYTHLTLPTICSV